MPLFTIEGECKPFLNSRRVEEISIELLVLVYFKEDIFKDKENSGEFAVALIMSGLIIFTGEIDYITADIDDLDENPLPVILMKLADFWDCSINACRDLINLFLETFLSEE